MSLNGNTILNVITAIHIQDDHILSKLIIDITLLVEDQCSINGISIIFTDVFSKCFISLNRDHFTFINLKHGVNQVKLEVK